MKFLVYYLNNNYNCHRATRHSASSAENTGEKWFFSVNSAPRWLTNKKIMKPTLLILAAGVGSRYGGLKQLDPVGPSGEVIMDYSVYDAIRAGFGKVVFVIRHEFEEQFREKIGNKYSNQIQVEYAFQELDDIPEGFSIPEGRTKPWGTSHAILAARNIINEPFAMINADDFYGKEAYEKLSNYLQNTDVDSTAWCMVGFKLENTLSEFGGVTRGVCEIENGLLKKVVEHFEIRKEVDSIVSSAGRLPDGTLASMNFWGFTPVLFQMLEKDFVTFLEKFGMELKSEYLIPTSVDEYISSGRATLEVLSSDSRWFGVTYPDDKPFVQKSIKDLVDKGVYPAELSF